MSSWVKGQCGNPSGRPKEDEEMKEAKRLARQHGPAAMAVLAELMADADPRVRATAAQAILDRAYGKPTQSVDAEIRQLNYDALVLELINGRSPES